MVLHFAASPLTSAPRGTSIATLGVRIEIRKGNEGVSNRLISPLGTSVIRGNPPPRRKAKTTMAFAFRRQVRLRAAETLEATFSYKVTIQGSKTGG
jgi:hypothetical protein